MKKIMGSIMQTYTEALWNEIDFAPPLFYRAKFGIRFELGPSNRLLDNENYFKIAYDRAVVLFNAIFKRESSLIFLYVDYEPIAPFEDDMNSEEDFFRTFHKDRESQIEILRIKEIYDEDSNKLVAYEKSYGFMSEVTDIDIMPTLGMLSGFANEAGLYIRGRVYLIEPVSKIVYYLYDHRGLDVVSPAKESIDDLYRVFNDWILKHDRERVDRVFGAG